jgi:voltage-gated potassium channel
MPLVRRLFTAEGLKYTALLAFLTALAGGVAFHQAEGGQSFWDGLYWSVTTMTTVGYGDLTPHSTAGRIIALIVMLVGIGFVALVTGAVAQAFIAPRALPRDGASDSEAATEDELLIQVRELSSKMGELERALEERLRSSDTEAAT